MPSTQLSALAGALVFAGLAMALPAASAPEKSPAGIRYYGRWDRRDPAKAVTVNSGSHLVARFNGTGVVARFDTARNRAPFPTLAWRIDSGEWQEAEVTGSVELAKGLKRGEHTVFLMVRDLDEHQPRWSEPLTASVTFTGLTVQDGVLIAPPADPKLKLEFLGDSITEGVLVHKSRPGKETWPWMGDGRLAYSAQTAMRLGAQWRQVGFGRLGVLIEGNGGVPPSADSFNFFYAGVPRDDWQPDVVIVNQGTNDGGRPSDVFRPAYRRYLETIRAAYPNAWIAALRPFGGFHGEDVLSEVTARGAAGDRKIFFVDTTGWLTREDYTDGVHPNVEGGAKAADRLAAVLRQRLRLE